MKKKIQLVCEECLTSNYSTNKSSKKERLILKKHCKRCNKSTTHKENK
jgi:large subunit ribosomal protein L33